MLTNKTNVEKLERTNKRAIRFATNKCHESYVDICHQEKQLNVYRKFVKNTAMLMYKVRKGIAPSCVSELFCIQEYMTKGTMRNLLCLNTTQCAKARTVSDTTGRNYGMVFQYQ